MSCHHSLQMFLQIELNDNMRVFQTFYYKKQSEHRTSK